MVIWVLLEKDWRASLVGLLCKWAGPADARLDTTLLEKEL